jgi:MFS family permease
VTAALIGIPFAAFYTYTPTHLSQLGLPRITAWMSLGQASEVIALVSIGYLLHRFSIRTIVILGIICGLMRFTLYAFDQVALVLLGLSLHGVAFTFTYVTTQIYLAERIDAAWRARAQALLSLMTGGIGNLTGYLMIGAWFNVCTENGQTDWRVYWTALTLFIAAVLVYFVFSFRSIREIPA